MALSTLILVTGSASTAACSCSCSSTSRDSRSLEQVRSRDCSSVRFLRRSKASETGRCQKWQILSTASDDYPNPKRAKERKKIEEFMPDFDELDNDELKGFLELELESTQSTFNLEVYKHYEIMFLIHENYVNEVQAVVKEVQDFIGENKGVIHRLDDWGMRSLAYKIKKASKANYLLMNIEINNQAINDLNTLLEKDERVIRHMVITEKAAITAKSVPPEEYRSSSVGEEEQEKEDEEDEEEEENEDGASDKEEEAELVLQSQ